MATVTTHDEVEGRAKQLRFSFDVMSPEDLGEMLGLTTQTLAGWRASNTGPAYSKIGKVIFYLRSDVARWIRNKRIMTTEVAEAE